MALFQFLLGLTGMIILSSKGCHSQQLQCGQASRNTKIVGGADASPGSWPWQASLVNNNGHFCGGTLISKLWVMTAAHCMRRAASTIRVYLGRQSLSGPNPKEVLRRVAQITCHPSYNSLTNDNDICLLKLSSAVKFGNFIQPVCLAGTGTNLGSRISSWVTGWGETSNGNLSNILQEVNVPLIGNNECRCTYPSLTQNMICAGFRTGGKDACRGDSGGPLMIKVYVNWIQIGIVSFGRKCDNPVSPGVYTRVSKYEKWINNITSSSKVEYIAFASSGINIDPEFNCPASQSATNAITIQTTPTQTTSTTTNPKCMYICCIQSIFSSGENVIHFSHFTHFISLCSLVLCVLVGEA